VVNYRCQSRCENRRTVEEINQHCQREVNKWFNCSRPPMFDFIPLAHVVIDLLHSSLRASDVLTNFLKWNCQVLDGIQKSSDRSSGINVNAYESFLKKNVIFDFSFMLRRKAKNFAWHDLIRSEKKQVVLKHWHSKLVFSTKRTKMHNYNG